MTSLAAAPSPLRHATIAAVFIACAVGLGGGGSPSPAPEVLLQLVFVGAALAWLWLPSGPFPTIPRSRALWLICALVLALPLFQLIPLPPGVWSQWSGQEDRADALALVSAEGSWQTLSRSAPRTLAAVLAIVPALFAFVAVAALDSRGRLWVVAAIVAMALLSALFGALQVSLGADAPYLYPEEEHVRVMLTGFQANHNAAADLLLIGAAATAALFAPALGPRGSSRGRWRILADRRAAAIVVTGLLAVLLLATVLTASRAGIALIPLALLAVFVILRPALADLGMMRLVPPLVALAALAAVGLAAFAGSHGTLGGVAARFGLGEQSRPELWRDAWFAIQQAWPLGVGVGGAESALVAAERLEVLDPFVPNRVHNDYLELALEGGLPALAMLAAIVVLLAVAAVRSWRERPQDRHLTALGIAILTVVAAHSLVDYPLRSMALACLVGSGAGLLMRTPRLAARSADAENGSFG